MLEHDQIVHELRAGNENSFRKIFHAYYESLCQYAFTLLRDMDDAEDVVQSTFVKIWEKRQSLMITQSIRAYLYKSVYHQCINHFEYRAVRTKFSERNQLDKSDEIQHPEVFPNELEDRISAAISALPKQCRTIFIMSRFREMKYVEIAKELDISVNTIENQISKALRVLRAHFKD